MQQIHHQAGFSIIELIIVIVIIGILSGLVIYVPSGLRATARDQERVNDIAIISRRLEQAYTNQEIGKAAYPSTAEFSSDISTKTRAASRLIPEALMPPDTSTATVLMATSANVSTPTGVAGQPTISQYVYQPLTAFNGICTTSSATCVRYVLYYRSQVSGLLKSVKSFHQQ